MKVHIGPYINFFGPYQLAEKLCFWVRPVKDEYGMLNKPDWVHAFGEWLAHGDIEPEPEVGEIIEFNSERRKTLLYKLLLWVDSKKRRKVSVQIHRYDTWSMNNTLGLIILPLLTQLKQNKQGAPWVDDVDVPENLRSTAAAPKENEWDTDANHFLRWDWVLDEMIFAFTTSADDSWEEQFTTGTSDMQSIKQPDGNYQLVNGPKHTYYVDWEAKKIYAARIQRGFELFGKYYQDLWT